MLGIPRRSSFLVRLVLALGGAFVLFWLLSACLILFLDFRETKDELLKAQSRIADSVAQQESAYLNGIARDVLALSYFWRTMPNASGGNRRYLVTQYEVTDSHHQPTASQVRRAMDFVESYGSSNMGKFVDTFAVLDGGIAISSGIRPRPEVERHLKDVLSLRLLPERMGLVWGIPYQETDGSWRMIVAARDPATRVMVGVTVHLPLRFGLESMGEQGESEFTWFGANGQPFTPLPAGVPLNLAAISPGCEGSGLQEIGQFSAVCVEVEPTGWSVVQFYRNEWITQNALAELYKRLPAEVLSLLTLLILLYVVLQFRLRGTLTRFVNSISSQEAVSKQEKLPDNKTDELGQIARSYNRLVDTVREQSGEIETKVAERTAELEMARYLAERANAFKSEQITSISHEIRTPLNGILGALKLLKGTECSHLQGSLVDTALKCSDHLLEIINNLLDFSRIEAGQMVVTASMQDTLELIDQAMLTVQLEAQRKGLMLQGMVSASLPELVLTDGLRLRQILINLLGNAVKFTKEGSVMLSAWSTDNRVFFNVRDSGVGIAPEKYEEVFLAFRQLEDCAAGSGLGLPIARRLAQLLGGDLYLIAAECGASFQLELPLGDASNPCVSGSGPLAAPACLHPQLRMWGYEPYVGNNPNLESPELLYLPGRLRKLLGPVDDGDFDLVEGRLLISPWSLNVLIVDDIETNRSIVGYMLRQQGHQVHEASCGEDALSLGRLHVFDLVLMDMRMPGMSGDQTVGLWRNEASGMLDPGCPIVALTANALPGERERLKDKGFDEYLAKPLAPEVLARMLEFTADLQLSRGMDLSLNVENEQPVLGQSSILRERVAVDLNDYHRRLGEAQAVQDNAECSMLLHSIQGLAGQAGLTLVRERAERMERLLMNNEVLSQDDWDELDRQIEIVLHRDLGGDGLDLPLSNRPPAPPSS